MALQSAHGSFLWGSGDSVGQKYSVTGLGFQPALIMFWCGGMSNSSDAQSAALDMRHSIGFAASASLRLCYGGLSSDNVATTVCATTVSDDAVLATLSAAAARDGLLDLDAINADGFDAINDNAPPVDLRVFWCAWGGSDIAVVNMGSFVSPTSTGDQQYTCTGLTAGATDQALFVVGKIGGAALNGGSAVDACLSLGFATAAGASSAEQVVTCALSDAGEVQADTYHWCQHGYVVGVPPSGGGNIAQYAYLKSWDANAFTLNWGGTAAHRMFWVAVKGGSWKAGSLSLNATGLGNTATVNGLAKTPAGLLFMGVDDTEASGLTTAANHQQSIGVASSAASRRAMGQFELDAPSANSEVALAVDYDAVQAFPTQAGGLQSAYDLDAIYSDGFRIIVDDAGANSATWVGYLSWGWEVILNKPGAIARITRHRVAS